MAHVETLMEPDLPQNTIEPDLPQSSMEPELPQNTVQPGLPQNSLESGLPQNTEPHLSLNTIKQNNDEYENQTGLDRSTLQEIWYEGISRYSIFNI